MTDDGGIHMSPRSGPAGGDVVPEAGRGVDLQPDVERLHRAIRREPRDPTEGREPAPRFFVAAIAIAFLWGGWYLGRFGGDFNRTTHVAFAQREAGIAASASAQTAAAVSDPVQAGQRVFAKHCVACHQENGMGITGAFPPVVGSTWVTGPPETLVRILLHGMQGPVEVAGVTYNGAMPAWKEVLKDEEIAAVSTYLRQWAPNAASKVTTQQSAALRTVHADRAAAWTAAELKDAEVAGPPAAVAGASTTSNPGQAGPADTGVTLADPASPIAGSARRRP